MLKIVTSRDVMAELTRHRVASFAIESQRYVNESRETGGIRFIRPLFFDLPDPNFPETDRQERSFVWMTAMEGAEDDYNYLIDCGAKNEDARKVLPNSTATTIMMDINLRELLHIYKLRSANSAYPEMRECMRLLKIEVDKVLPGFLPEKEET